MASVILATTLLVGPRELNRVGSCHHCKVRGLGNFERTKGRSELLYAILLRLKYMVDHVCDICYMENVCAVIIHSLLSVATIRAE